MALYLYSLNSIIINVNKEFIDFTGFTIDELLGKSLIEIGAILKINSQIFLDSINTNYSGFIFTKLLEAREVEISLIHCKGTNKIKYTFIEKPNSRLKDKLTFVQQTFIDNVQGVAIFSVPDFILLKSNEKYLSFIDSPFTKKESSIGKQLREIVTGFAGSQSEHIWNTVLETQKSIYLKELQFDIFTKGIPYFDSSLVPIFEHGKIKYVYQTAIEVTHRVLRNQNLELQTMTIIKQKNQLEEKNKQLLCILENLSEGVMVSNSKGEYIFINQEARSLIHKSDQAITIGNSYKDIKYFDMERKKTLHKNLSGTGSLIGAVVRNHTVLVSNPSKEFYIQSNSIPIYDSCRNLAMVVSCFYDVTDTIGKSKKIEQQNKKLNAIIENMSDAFVIYDKHGQITHFNSEARKLYPKLNSQSKIDRVHNEFQYYDLDNNIILKENLPIIRAFKGETIRNEVVVIKKSNNLQITEINATPIFNRKNELISVAMSHRDISTAMNNKLHIKNQQELLLIASKEKNDALKEVIKTKDDFLYLITHELKTPLAVINLALQAIDHLCITEVTEKLGNYLKIINHNTNRQLRVVKNLLDVARMNSGQLKINMTNYNIEDIVESIINSVQLYAKRKNVNLQLFTHLSIKNIYSDEEKLERILLNLLSNALKFTPSSKSITVNLSTKIHKGINMISISVEDEGLGIPNDKQKIIFERFGQANKNLSEQAGGTGLGLYLVKLLVNVLGGEISLKSEVGNGSKFIVLLPTNNSLAVDEVASCNESLMNSTTNIDKTAMIEFSDINF